MASQATLIGASSALNPAFINRSVTTPQRPPNDCAAVGSADLGPEVAGGGLKSLTTAASADMAWKDVGTGRLSLTTKIILTGMATIFFYYESEVSGRLKLVPWPSAA